jgi:F0F1-type ATP synthase membrane subunit b/b'
MNELEQLAQVCTRLGASPEQASTMAAQLLKRANQLAAERGSAREAELARLLEFVVQGRAGVVPANFSPPPPRPPAAR